MLLIIILTVIHFECFPMNLVFVPGTLDGEFEACKALASGLKQNKTVTHLDLCENGLQFTGLDKY